MGLSLFFGMSFLHPPVFLSLSRHTGRPNSPASSWNKHLIAANLLDLKIQIWINVRICMDKMGEGGLGGGVEMMERMTACLDIYLKKKKRKLCP